MEKFNRGYWTNLGLIKLLHEGGQAAYYEGYTLKDWDGGICASIVKWLPAKEVLKHHYEGIDNDF